MEAYPGAPAFKCFVRRWDTTKKSSAPSIGSQGSARLQGHRTTPGIAQLGLHRELLSGRPRTGRFFGPPLSVNYCSLLRVAGDTHKFHQLTRCISMLNAWMFCICPSKQ